MWAAAFLPAERVMAIRIHQTIHEDRAVPGGRRLLLELRSGATRVPALLQLPDGTGPAPAALLFHGYGSRKEHMADEVGRVLMRHGIASLAIDLPLHGGRGDPRGAAAGQLGMMELMRHWNEARAEARLGLGYLRARAEVDRERVALVGYSLGAFLATVTAAAEPGVRAVVLAAGGDLPAQTPFAPLVRTVIDPLRAVRRLAGRPLLMVHGRHDGTVRADQAERLFAAAGEPKTLRWFDAGHRLPPAAIDFAAGWLAEALGLRETA
jgi:uncharacterized protein